MRIVITILVYFVEDQEASAATGVTEIGSEGKRETSATGGMIGGSKTETTGIPRRIITLTRIIQTTTKFCRRQIRVTRRV